jgi:hypothetical protein
VADLTDRHRQDRRRDHEPEDPQPAGLGTVRVEDRLVEVRPGARRRAVEPAQERSDEEERQEDVGEEEDRQHGGVREHPGQHPQGVVLAAARPAQLLLEQLLHLQRGVGVDEARVLVDGAVALLEREVGQPTWPSTDCAGIE